ncbi:MAG: hypothetical protein J6U66_02105, partial [Lachnospiraceae bacterium]|nr:hypothetical protein [Lachnospiraceae bacterium]
LTHFAPGVAKRATEITQTRHSDATTSFQAAQGASESAAPQYPDAPKSIQTAKQASEITQSRHPDAATSFKAAQGASENAKTRNPDAATSIQTAKRASEITKPHHPRCHIPIDTTGDR